MPLNERIERIRSLPEPPNEESAKAQVISPILNELGWKTDDPSRVFFGSSPVVVGGEDPKLNHRAGWEALASESA